MLRLCPWMGLSCCITQTSTKPNSLDLEVCILAEKWYKQTNGRKTDRIYGCWLQVCWSRFCVITWQLGSKKGVRASLSNDAMQWFPYLMPLCHQLLGLKRPKEGNIFLRANVSLLPVENQQNLLQHIKYLFLFKELTKITNTQFTI